MPVTRVGDARIQPLEIWDLEVEGQTLFAWKGDPTFPARLVEGVLALRRGSATFAKGPSPLGPRKLEFSSLYLTGGGSLQSGLLEAFAHVGLEVRWDPDPLFPGVQGALRISGSEETLGVDLGQTALKAWWRGRRVRFERDWMRLPLAAELSERQKLEGRRELVCFFGEAVRELCGEEVPDRVVLALPTQVSATGAVAACTYPYPAPDALLLQDLLRSGALEKANVSVLNDAELAAHSARAAFEVLPPRDAGAVLVLTLGFGVGAALLQP